MKKQKIITPLALPELDHSVIELLMDGVYSLYESTSKSADYLLLTNAPVEMYFLSKTGNIKVGPLPLPDKSLLGAAVLVQAARL